MNYTVGELYNNKAVKKNMDQKNMAKGYRYCQTSKQIEKKGWKGNKDKEGNRRNFKKWFLLHIPRKIRKKL